MKAAQKVSRAPHFSTYTEVDVEISPEDLEQAGWVYVGAEATKDGFADPRIIHESEAVEIVHRWHDEEHPMPWMWCDHRPCKDVRS